MATRKRRTKSNPVFMTVVAIALDFDDGVMGAADNAMLELEARLSRDLVIHGARLYDGFLTILGQHRNAREAQQAVATLLRGFPAPWQMLNCIPILTGSLRKDDVESPSIYREFRGYHEEVLPEGQAIRDWWLPRTR